MAEDIIIKQFEAVPKFAYKLQWIAEDIIIKQFKAVPEFAHNVVP